MGKVELFERIQQRHLTIGVVGLGYVGLPLALAFSKAGFRVFGYDIDVTKIQNLQSHRSYVPAVSSGDLYKSAAVWTSVASQLATCDVAILCVPTPLTKGGEPDMRYVYGAVDTVCTNVEACSLIVLESTTYPGTTEELEPYIAFNWPDQPTPFLAFSPEREDPGNAEYSTTDIPKVVGGLRVDASDVVEALYRTTFRSVVRVSSSRVAEMTKLLENSYRLVNIALINEFKAACQSLGIDVWEVIRAASSKPFGFQPFYPGPGVGGHCIPIDPLYLSHRLGYLGLKPITLIDAAHQVNKNMPRQVANAVLKLIVRELRKTPEDARVMIFGVTYKRDVPDVRESPALDIIDILLKWGIQVSYYDPFVPHLDNVGNSTTPSPELLRSLDVAVVVTDHSAIDHEQLAVYCPFVVDTRNAVKSWSGNVISA